MVTPLLTRQEFLLIGRLQGCYMAKGRRHADYLTEVFVELCQFCPTADKMVRTPISKRQVPGDVEWESLETPPEIGYPIDEGKSPSHPDCTYTRFSGMSDGKDGCVVVVSRFDAERKLLPDMLFDYLRPHLCVDDLAFQPEGMNLATSLEEYRRGEEVQANRTQLQSDLIDAVKEDGDTDRAVEMTAEFSRSIRSVGKDEPNAIQSRLSELAEGAGNKDVFDLGFALGAVEGLAQRIARAIYRDSAPLDDINIPTEQIPLLSDNLRSKGPRAAIKCLLRAAQHPLFRDSQMLVSRIGSEIAEHDWMIDEPESNGPEDVSLDGLTREELIKTMPRLAAVAELLFGYAFGKLGEVGAANNGPNVAVLLGRSFRIKSNYAPSQIREALRVGWQLFLAQGAHPENVVLFIVGAIEALAKHVFPKDFNRIASVEKVLHDHLHDPDTLCRQFARSALNLYRWFRNDAVHGFATTFECDWSAALSLYFGIQHLLNLHGEIEERGRGQE